MAHQDNVNEKIREFLAPPVPIIAGLPVIHNKPVSPKI